VAQCPSESGNLFDRCCDLRITSTQGLRVIGIFQIEIAASALWIHVCRCGYFRIGEAITGISSGAGTSVSDSSVRDSVDASSAALPDG
jgi:hypothetical protein